MAITVVFSNEVRSTFSVMSSRTLLYTHVVTERLDEQRNGTKTENLSNEGNHGKVCHLVKVIRVFLQSVCYICPFLNRNEIRRKI